VSPIDSSIGRESNGEHMPKRLTVVITVLQDGRGRVETIRTSLLIKGMRGWSKAKQARLYNLLSDYAINVKGAK